MKKDIRPLVLIQFPSGQPERIELVEKKLADMGYTYDNGMVAKWMSEDKKDLTDDITVNNGSPVFLLMKQDQRLLRSLRSLIPVLFRKG